MDKGLYRKLAWNNIKKNYRFYVPRILAEIGLLGCLYIAVTLYMDGRLAQVRGGEYIPTFMLIAVIVLSILSVVLMFYTNSFLMKQRKREFGLYNILGMEKKHVGKVLFHESFISTIFSVIGGIGLGILFYKLCSLLICKLLQADIIIGFYFITPLSIIPSAAFFVLIDLVTFLINRISIARMKPVDLLASKSVGEKEPKTKWVLLVLGIITLGAGYYIALTTKSPLEALLLFLLAVILVIIGTYFLFVAGSTFVLRALKKNKKYYYNKKHMPSVSGLLYRMKQNAVGLASIAILATGVMVMVSTTVSLYSGMDGTLRKNFPQDFYFEAHYTTVDNTIKELEPEQLSDIVSKAAAKNNVEIKSTDYNKYLYVTYGVEGHALVSKDEAERNFSSMEGITNFIFITEDTYTKLGGEKLDLKDGEVALCRIITATSKESLKDNMILHGKEYSIKKYMGTFPISITVLTSGFDSYGVVVKDNEVLNSIYKGQIEEYGYYSSNYTERLAISFAERIVSSDAGQKFNSDVITELENYLKAQPDFCGKLQFGGEGYYYDMDSYWEARESMVGMYGTLLFLGILLGAVCMFATVLIIYYKQISEGYEDRDRFQIMEKVGMSQQEVKKTINSQVLLVFFLPLIVAGIHLAVVHPLLAKMLNILSLYSPSLFLVCTLITFAVFAVVYILIYKGTSRTYYKIVH